MTQAAANQGSENALPVASRYFIARHIPDPFRNEPRNIGVVFWTPYGTFTRFLGESQTGSLDTRSLPSFVADRYQYREWVIYWHKHVGQGLDEILGPLESLVYGDEPKIQETLAAQLSKTQWSLIPGGVLMDPISSKEEGKQVLDRLFSDLIGDYLPAEVEVEVVNKVVKSLVKSLGLNRNPHLEQRYGIVSKKRKDYKFEVDYAYVGKTVYRIWEMLPVMPNRKQQETYSESVAFRLDQVRDIYSLQPADMRVLINMNTKQEKAHKAALRMVGDISQVLNLKDTESRLAAFADLPSLDGLEGTELGNL